MLFNGYVSFIYFLSIIISHKALKLRNQEKKEKKEEEIKKIRFNSGQQEVIQIFLFSQSKPFWHFFFVVFIPHKIKTTRVLHLKEMSILEELVDREIKKTLYSKSNWKNTGLAGNDFSTSQGMRFATMNFTIFKLPIV